MVREALAKSSKSTSSVLRPLISEMVLDKSHKESATKLWVGPLKALKSKGFVVSGSDFASDFITKKSIDRLNIPILEFGRSADFIMEADLIVSSSAYNENNNQDFALAKKAQKIILFYPEALSYFFNKAKVRIAVCGTHGKTTTTSMISVMLRDLGLNFTSVIGASPLGWDANFYVSKDMQDEIFVIEADEYKGAFLNYKPNILVVTNIDYDHPDFFKSKKEAEDFGYKPSKRCFKR